MQSCPIRGDSVSPTALFVYGTLMPGQRAHDLVAAHVASAQPATTDGWLYAFPAGYPGLLDRPGHRVHGWVLELLRPAEVLPVLDRYEGDDYVRGIRAIALSDDRSIDAWCYRLADPALIAGAEPIPSGSWIQYQQRTEV